jgi:hypothetical protein
MRVRSAVWISAWMSFMSVSSTCKVGWQQAELVPSGSCERRAQSVGDLLHRCGRRRRLLSACREDPGRLLGPEEIQHRNEVAGVLRRWCAGQYVAADGEMGEVQAGGAPLAVASALHPMRLVEDQVARGRSYPFGDRCKARRTKLLVVDAQDLAAGTGTGHEHAQIGRRLEAFSRLGGPGIECRERRDGE